MIRWLSLIIGVGLIALSVFEKLKFPPLPETPEQLTVEQAVALTVESNDHYVELKASADPSKKIYPTVCTRPLYTGRDPAQKYDVPCVDGVLPADIDSYLGVVVKVARPLEADAVSLRTVVDRKGKEKEVLKQRLLAAVEGCGGKLWAISPVYESANDGCDLWHRSRNLEGPLTRIADLNRNMRSPRLEHEWTDLRAFIKEKHGRDVPDDSYLIITDYEWHPPNYYYRPVAGSGDALFVTLTAEKEAACAGSITGILRPRKLKMYGGFADVLGKTLPERIGVISLETAGDYNRHMVEEVTGMRILGAVFCALAAVLWMFRAIFRKRKKRST